MTTKTTTRTWKTADEIAHLFMAGREPLRSGAVGDKRLFWSLTAKQAAWLRGQWQRENPGMPSNRTFDGVGWHCVMQKYGSAQLIVYDV